MAEIATSGSMRLRLAGMLITTGAIMAALLVLVFQSFARQIATEAQDSQLLASATSILESAVLEDGELLIDIPYSALSMLGSVSEDRVFYHIALDEEFLSGYEDLVTLPIGAETTYSEAEHLGAKVRIASTTRRMGLGEDSAILSVSVAQTRDGINDRLSNISRQAIGIGAGFFVLASLLAFFVSYRVFRPLDQLANSVSRRGPKDLTPIKQIVPDEMATLVGSLNEFTSRLRRALAGSEDFITEAAHRIRTPLATVRMQAEIAIKRSKSDANRQALISLIKAVDETSRTSGQLLDHAMVNLRSDVLNRSRIPVDKFIQEIINRVKPIADLKEITIQFQTAPNLEIDADPIVLESAIGNILDNSLKYAPEESSVEISARLNAENIEIKIADQGPGFPEAQIDELFTRFKRGSASKGTIGSGLGLTIAKDAIAAHDGSIELSNTNGGGACVTILLPI